MRIDLPDKRIVVYIPEIISIDPTQGLTDSSHGDMWARCRAAGIRFMLFWPDEWRCAREICQSIVDSKSATSSIFARKCELVELPVPLARRFLELEHLQGSCQFDRAWGLEHEGAIVQVATLGGHHRSGEGYVMSRVATKRNVRVVGGLSRLLAQFPRPLVTWSDNRISWGEGYKKLGFVQDGILRPDYQYWRAGCRYSKPSLRKAAEERVGALTERELRLAEGYTRIWDCGKIRWKLD